MRRKPRATRNSSPSNSATPTGGRVFNDVTVIELVGDLSQPSGLALLKWNRRRIVGSPRIVHAGKTYVPLQLGPSMTRALRLPTECAQGEPDDPTLRPTPGRV